MKSALLASASVLAIGLIMYGKYRLAVSKVGWVAIGLGAFVFAITSTSKADASTTEDRDETF